MENMNFAPLHYAFKKHFDSYNNYMTILVATLHHFKISPQVISSQAVFISFLQPEERQCSLEGEDEIKA